MRVASGFKLVGLLRICCEALRQKPHFRQEAMCTVLGLGRVWLRSGIQVFGVLSGLGPVNPHKRSEKYLSHNASLTLPMISVVVRFFA